jgi:magnesium-transporting ATPase (P-type)
MCAQATLLLISVFSVFFLYQPTFTAMQLFWISIILDIFGSISLASSQAVDSVLSKSPIRQEKRIYTSRMNCQVMMLCAYQVVLLGLILRFSTFFFNLPYRWDTPALITPELVSDHPEVYSAEQIGETSNKTIIFTMFTNTFILMQCSNLCYFKFSGQPWDWRKFTIGSLDFWLVIAIILAVQ